MASLDSEVLGKDYFLIWIMLFTFPYDRFFFIPFNKQIIIYTVLSLYNCVFLFSSNGTIILLLIFQNKDVGCPRSQVV